MDKPTSIQEMISVASACGQKARFSEMLDLCQQIIEVNKHNTKVLVEIGILLLSYGFLANANFCFSRCRAIAPKDPGPVINLANLAREAGLHGECRRLYLELQKCLPDNPIIRRNALISLEYDPDASNEERLKRAQAWGNWAINSIGGQRPRPSLKPFASRPLRVAYLSADLCQHTVGLFVKDVLANHCSDLINVTVYSAGQIKDWVTAEIRRTCSFRDVYTMDDKALAEQIRQDEIDFLVDLSGHTGGSRLMVFAHRPAPVQVSWLGYFATTGLPYIDAVLLDEWHAPPGIEAQFIEPIVRLPKGRFCYQPVPWAPAEVATAPCLKAGHITFGCFNNTAKLNAGVFEVWSKILAAVPDSRLVLKWRNFVDETFSRSVQDAFASRGIAIERVELRGASFHVDVLKEYSEIDIGLDPFPFSGGLTSCEALWMGVPVITWPQDRAVSRQSYALLCAIGLSELAAGDANDYVRISMELANDRQRLINLRCNMRQRMQSSSLMDVSGFTRQLENTFIDLYRNCCQISE